jgi:lipoate-protein ligase A
MSRGISDPLLTAPPLRPRGHSWSLDSAEAGLALETAAIEELARSGRTPVRLVWQCPPALIVTRTEARLSRFAQAAEALRARGWPVLVRGSGGGACPLGAGTVQCALVRVLPSGTSSIEHMYGAMAAWIRRPLARLGIATSVGSVPGAFCPGNHEIVAGRKKIAGIAQHWRTGSAGSHLAIATASINVEHDPESLAAVVNQFYRLAGGSHRCLPSALTSVRAELARPGRERDGLMRACVEQLHADAPQ